MARHSNFIVRGGANFNPLYRELNKSQKRLSSFQKGINKTLKTIGLTLSGLAVGKLVKDSTKAAMGVESSIAQLDRIMGESAAVFDSWAKTQAKAFGMAREEAYKYGATYGNLISTFTKNTQETTQYTTELLKASAVVASATGRTMEDTMERIRSGLLGNTEAIEDLGINVNVAMLESTKAFKQFAKGRSWQQLAFQEQQQIRLMAILEQANTKYGDSLAGTTATRQMMFIATLKNIRLNLGQAFLPIYNVVLPILTSLASKLEYVTSVLSEFSQALFGTSQVKQAKATQTQANAVEDLGDATEEAGKKAKGAVAGFDEINKLGMNEAGVGVSGLLDNSEGATLDNLVTQEDGSGGVMGQTSTKAKEMAQKVRTAFENMKNAIVENKDIIVPAIGAIKGALAGLALYTGFTVIISAFKNLGIAAKSLWLLLAGNPIMLVFAAIGALIGGFISAYKNNDKFREKVDKLWASIKEKMVPILDNLKSTIIDVWNNAIKPTGSFIAEIFVSAWEKLGNIVKWVWNKILEPIGRFLQWLWKEVLAPVACIIRDVLAIAFDLLGSIVKNLWINILVPLGVFLGTVFIEIVRGVIDILVSWWNKALKPIANFLITVFRPIIEGIIDAFEFLWKNVLKPLIKYMTGTFKTSFETVTEGIKGVIEGIQTTFKGLINFIAGVFTNDWRRAWEGVRNIFKGIFDSLYGFVKAPLNLIIDAINKVISGLNRLSIDIPDWVPGIGGRSWGINIPKIPKLARGGIVTSPTIAMIGEQGPEAVVPLENTGFVNAIASAVGTAVMSAVQFANNSENQQGDIILQIDGTTLARVLNPYMTKENKRIGSTMITTT